MNKAFDCVRMKRQIQSKIYKEIQGMTREEQLDYFHKAADDFWKNREKVREMKKHGQEQTSE